MARQPHGREQGANADHGHERMGPRLGMDATVQAYRTQENR